MNFSSSCGDYRVGIMQATSTNEARFIKKICSWTTSEGFTLLNVDLIIEILSWLPAKCLTRYKSVCKLWCMIIKSRKFIEKHMQQAKPFTCDETTICQQPFEYRYIFDGLIFERNMIDGYLRIRNHTTNCYLELPVQFKEGQQKVDYYVSMSFNYDPSSEKYKVLTIHRKPDRVGICMNVLTVGVDVTWRLVQVPFSCWNEKEMVYSKTLNRVTYILRVCFNKYCPPEIFAFQMDDERLVKVPLPQRVEVLYSAGSHFRTIAWDNKFGIWCRRKGVYHVFVLQDHKRAEWDEKKIAIPSTVFKQYPFAKFYGPCQVIGTIVFINSSEGLPLRYDFKSKEVSWASTFKKIATSLVSLF